MNRRLFIALLIGSSAAEGVVFLAKAAAPGEVAIQASKFEFTPDTVRLMHRTNAGETQIVTISAQAPARQTGIMPPEADTEMTRRYRSQNSRKSRIT